MDLIANASESAITPVSTIRHLGAPLSTYGTGRWIGADVTDAPRGALEQDKSVLAHATMNLTRIRLPRSPH